MLAPCKRDKTAEAAEALRACLRSETYRVLAKRPRPLDEEQVRGALAINEAIEGVGELRLT